MMLHLFSAPLIGQHTDFMQLFVVLDHEFSTFVTKSGSIWRHTEYDTSDGIRVHKLWSTVHNFQHKIMKVQTLLYNSM